MQDRVWNFPKCFFLKETAAENVEEAEDAVDREIREERDLTNWLNEIFAASKLLDFRYFEGAKHRGRVLKIGGVVRDCKDGLVLLCFMDLLAPRTVDWDKVNRRKEDGAALSRSECLLNCHYAVSMLFEDPFCGSLQRVDSMPSDGHSLYDGNRPLIVAAARTLINFHYLRTLTQIMGRSEMLKEEDVLLWTNHELKTAKMLPRFCRLRAL